MDLVMRKIGKTGLKKFLKPKQIKKIETKLKAHTIWALFTASALPPPFPFTPIVWTASVLQGPRWKLFAGILLGRLVRFTVEAVLASIFGKQLLKVADFKVFTYSIYILIAVSVGGSLYYLYRWDCLPRRLNQALKLIHTTCGVHPANLTFYRCS